MILLVLISIALQQLVSENDHSTPSQEYKHYNYS